MSISSTTTQWREEETKNLRSFIIRCLLGSVGLHLGVLFFIGLFLRISVSEITTEPPIEVTIVELPQEVAKLPEQKPDNSLRGKNSHGGGGGIGGSSASSSLASQNITVSSVKNPLTKTITQPQKLVSAPVPKPVENSKPQPSTQPVKVASKEIPPPDTSQEIAKPTEVTIKPVFPPVQSQAPKLTQQTTTPTTQNSPIATAPSSSERIRKLLEDAKKAAESKKIATNTNENNARSSSDQASTNTPLANTSRTGNGTGTGTGTGNGSGTGIGNGIGNGAGNGSGSGVGNGTGNGTGNGSGTGVGNGIGTGTGRSNGFGTNNNSFSTPSSTKPSEVAVAPKPPSQNTSSKLNPSDCSECKLHYPERARQRHVEGNPQVEIDYDGQGRVTKTRLTRSSGNRELDEALLSDARNFKLKPSEGGKQRVRVSGNYAIEGTQRYRELQERQRQREQQRKEREAQQRQQQASQQLSADNSTSNQEETIWRRPRKQIITDVSPETTNQRNREENQSDQTRTTRTKPDASTQGEGQRGRRQRRVNSETSNGETPRKRRTQTETSNEETPTRRRVQSDTPNEETPTRHRVNSETSNSETSTRRRKREVESQQPARSNEDQSERRARKIQRLQELLLPRKRREPSSEPHKEDTAPSSSQTDGDKQPISDN